MSSVNEQVVDLLERHPNGLSTAEIYTLGPEFVSKEQVSKAVAYLNMKGVVKKIGENRTGQAQYGLADAEPTTGTTDDAAPDGDQGASQEPTATTTGKRPARKEPTRKPKRARLAEIPDYLPIIVDVEAAMAGYAALMLADDPVYQAMAQAKQQLEALFAAEQERTHG